MQPTIDASRIKRYGQWSVKDEKLRITYNDSEESVLFEDTSSISYLMISNPNPLYFSLSLLIGFGLSFGGILYGGIDVSFLVFFFLCTTSIGLILTYKNKIKFDNIAVETRGGKIIRFSVDYGKGKSIMEQIEEEKRKWEMNKK